MRVSQGVLSFVDTISSAPEDSLAVLVFAWVVGKLVACDQFTFGFAPSSYARVGTPKRLDNLPGRGSATIEMVRGLSVCR
jgi:hypothetical protein